MTLLANPRDAAHAVWLEAAKHLSGERPTALGARSPGELALALDPKTIQTPALKLIDDALVDVAEGRETRLMVSLAPQEGKALALDTPIATPIGWTTMGALKRGDQVFDRHGKPCTVTWLSPVWRDRPCYEVRTGDGERIVADVAHEWVVKLTRRGPERVYQTDVLAMPRGKNAQITGPTGLDLPDADLPLDPYVLGAWLGDGRTDGAEITCADNEIVERIRAAGWPVRKRPGGLYSWTLSPEGWGNGRAPGRSVAEYSSPFRQALVAAGVFKNKHIPAAYLRGSTAQRIALLQGLVDTDGHVIEKGQVEFTTTLPGLAEDVRHLVFTLGAKATIGIGRATIDGKDCGPKYRVRFYLAEAASLPRKAARCRDSSVARTRYVWAEPTDSVPVRCIEVDSPDHTYLAGRSLLPTHNSERTSRRFPTWMLMRNPDLRIAIISYAHRIARRWGKTIRDDIQSHGRSLGLKLNPASLAAHEWELLGHRGGVYCTGIQGSLTSRAVDLLIIDDPYKDAKWADSDAWRETVQDFWTGVAIPRLGPKVAVVIIQTRWRHDDMSGWLQRRDDGINWRVINIPAQADHDPAKGETDPLGRQPGEYYESTRGRTVEDWEQRKREMGSRDWLALCQGRPSPAKGSIFNRDWWQFYDTPQWIVRSDGSCWALSFDDVIISWDMAFKKTEDTDYVCGQVWGRRGADLFLLDQVHARMTFTETLVAFRQLAARWPQAILKLVEDKANGPAVIDSLRRQIGGIVAVEPRGSKLARASAVSPFVESGNVFIPDFELCPWADGFVEEAQSFPRGANDDRVDAFSQAADRLLLDPILAEDEIVGDPDQDDAEGSISPY